MSLYREQEHDGPIIQATRIFERLAIRRRERGAQGVIDFLIKSFDARQTRRYDMPDGSIMHAEVHIDDTVVMIDDGADDNPAFPIWVHVYVCPTWMRHTPAGSRSRWSPRR
jgi:PhnB protein